jgi:hypothetical protein
MKTLITLALSVVGLTSVYGAVVDIKTVTVDNGSLLDSPAANRLFSATGSTATANRVPVGTSIWFVADTQNDGILTSPTVGGILETGDDVLLFAGSVAGPSSGTAGRYVHEGLTIPDTVGAGNAAISSVDIYAYLWNSSSPAGAGFVPVGGSKFGTLNLGKTSFPAIGNGFWAIDQNIFSDTHTVQAAAVPETGSFATIAGLSLLTLAAVRRMNRRQN